jgi:hypothetical protein
MVFLVNLLGMLYFMKCAFNLLGMIDFMEFRYKTGLEWVILIKCRFYCKKTYFKDYDLTL